MELEFEAMLKAAPTTEDGGDIVLFDKDQFVGQFHTGEDAAACIKERCLKRPTLLALSMLQRRSYTYLDGKLYVF